MRMRSRRRRRWWTAGHRLQIHRPGIERSETTNGGAPRRRGEHGENRTEDEQKKGPTDDGRTDGDDDGREFTTEARRARSGRDEIYREKSRHPFARPLPAPISVSSRFRLSSSQARLVAPQRVGSGGESASRGARRGRLLPSLEEEGEDVDRVGEVQAVVVVGVRRVHAVRLGAA